MEIHPTKTSMVKYVDHPVHENHPQPHLAPFFKHGHLKKFDILVSKSKQVSNIDMLTLVHNVAT
jgi:hypothetical protein